MLACVLSCRFVEYRGNFPSVFYGGVKFALILRIATISIRLLLLPAGLSTSPRAVLLVPHFECCWHFQEKRVRRAEEVRGLAGAAAFGKVTVSLRFAHVQKVIILLSPTTFCFQLSRTLLPYISNGTDE